MISFKMPPGGRFAAAARVGRGASTPYPIAPRGRSQRMPAHGRALGPFSLRMGMCCVSLLPNLGAFSPPPRSTPQGQNGNPKGSSSFHPTKNKVCQKALKLLRISGEASPLLANAEHGRPDAAKHEIESGLKGAGASRRRNVW